ncbi:hypothetical protein ONS96_004288 [Cadophora gregata f. sp. sojae]|nr:hypothetical protein ONS96_004288 [Cadophora gregata f. sp. sojae]
MATIGGSSTRSLHGCWTCRVRKKKCPENRPSCSTCVSLKIECFGYGERPLWMDSGPLQKEQALTLKRRISQSKRRRRTRRVPDTASPPPDQSKDLSTVHGEASHNAESVSSDSSDQNQVVEGNWDLDVLNDSQLQIWSHDLDLGLLNEDFINGISQDNIPAGGSFQAYTGDANIDWLGYDLHGGLSSKVAKVGAGAMASPECDESIPRIGDTQPILNLFPVNMPPADDHSSLAQLPSTTSSTGKMGHISDNLLAKVPFEEEIEDILTINYLDEVFFMQYPFYNTPRKQTRGWLFSAMTRVESIRFATLALSEYTIQSKTTSRTSTQPKTPPYYDLAIKATQLDTKTCDDTGVSCLTLKLERMFCGLQMLFYQIFGKRTSTWRYDLQTAARFVPGVVRDMVQQTKVTYGEQEPKEDSKSGRVGAVACGVDIGSKLILGSVVWLDILWSASTRSPLSTDLDHRRILDTFEIELGGLFGCTSRVALLLHDIVHLDNWKKMTEVARKLSMTELVKRGAEIETLLQQELAHLQGSGATSSQNFTASQLEISSIFARSALTYLHIVISGAHPEMPEIEESVSLTLSAFRSMTDPKLLQSLALPFCITGCLAVENQQPIFRELMMKAEITTPRGRGCLEAIGIIEQCWEMRRTCYHSCDWAFIMERRGNSFILF